MQNAKLKVKNVPNKHKSLPKQTLLFHFAFCIFHFALCIDFRAFAKEHPTSPRATSTPQSLARSCSGSVSSQARSTDRGKVLDQSGYDGGILVPIPELLPLPEIFGRGRHPRRFWDRFLAPNGNAVNDFRPQFLGVSNNSGCEWSVLKC